MIERIRIVGARGRVGSAVSARLAERGIPHDAPDPELVLLCVPDRAIEEVAAETPTRALDLPRERCDSARALDPHVRRFGLHPLQTFSKALGPEQLDGAWGAVSAESDEARAVGRWLAETLGLRPFDLADDARSAYHAGASMASNYLVTLRAAAGSLLEAAGAPPEALDPSSAASWTRFRAHGTDRTGRLGDGRAAPDGHPRRAPGARGALPRSRRGDRPHRRSRPGGGAGVKVVRTIAESRDALAPLRSGSVGLVPTMGSLHDGHLALLHAARAENDTAVMSLFVNPAQFGDASDLARYPRDEERDLGLARDSGVDLVFAPSTR